MTGPAVPAIAGLRYLRPLGSGGYCDVLLYEQDQPHMRVAVKVLTAPGLSDERRRQFTAEGNAMAALSDHPYIVAVYRAGMTDDGRPFLVMPFYPEANLAQRARHERIPVAEVLRIGIQISSAVETAHRSGILHRDIKPANILGGPYGNPGLTDFGVAAFIADTAIAAEGLSVPWAPPEVLLDSAPPDGPGAGAVPGVRGDVYSLAATVWHLLAGRSPFEQPGGDNSANAISRRIIAGPPVATGRPDVPESLDRLLVQAMSANPALRPTSALALARGLQRIEQEQRLPLTQIVLPAGARLAEAAATTSATRIRTAIPAHPPAASPSDPRPPTPPLRIPPPAPPWTAGTAAPPARPGPIPAQPGIRSAPGPGAPSAPGPRPYTPTYAQWPPPAHDRAPALPSASPDGIPPGRGAWLEHRWAASPALVVVTLALIALVLVLIVAYLTG